MKNETYEEFVEKFKPKKTTDDCYTPPKIYDAVADFVAEEYGLNRENFVRPFYPGGDYENYEYKPDDVVVDNPPFSILSKIVRFYHEKGIKYFLFAPHLTLFSTARELGKTYIITGISITYENGAKVNTSFITNLNEGVAIKTSPKLYELLNKAEDDIKANLPKFEYPDCVISSAMLGNLSKYKIDFKINQSDVYPISKLESQKSINKSIFGGGFLISEKAAAEKAAAEKAAAEKKNVNIFELSEREKEIVKSLGKKEEV